VKILPRLIGLRRSADEKLSAEGNQWDGQARNRNGAEVRRANWQTPHGRVPMNTAEKSSINKQAGQSKGRDRW
jgi:hypothetical protein